MTIGEYTPDEPICAIATALAPSAIGIVRTSGKGCIELVSALFSRPKALLSADGNSLVYGWIGKKPADKERDLKFSDFAIDEVMIGVYRSPKSFTGEDMAEIFCHGGPSVVTAIHKLLLKNGFRQALPGEYTFRAYVNGKADLTKAEAIKEIIDSRTDTSRSHAAGRLAGTLMEEINGIKQTIIDAIAAIEVEIEYPEDEENFTEQFDSSLIKNAIFRLQTLSDSWKGEKLYQDGARVVLAGRTNAGKSSLFNAILKEERAIVSDIEGTTRDWLESWASINGIPVRLFDTAGLRKTDDAIEARGVELSRSLSEEADVVLYLADSQIPLTDEDILFVKDCKEPVIVVFTKIDKKESQKDAKNGKISILDLKNRIKEAKNDGVLFAEVSSKTGEGISGLLKEIEGVITSGIPSEREQAGIGSLRQKQAVEEALSSARHALVSADADYALDATVQDLEDALDSLSELTGEITPDDVLSTIFLNFCVGK